MNLELRFVARRLLGRFQWTASAVAMIALIVGASTAQFAAVYGLILKRYPFPNADRLVVFWEENRDTDVRRLPLTESAYPIYRERLASLVRIANFVPPSKAFPVRLPDGAPVSYARASPELFSVLGATPLHGRTFTPEEGVYPAEDVVVLSHRYWMRHFGGDSSVVGTSIDLILAGERTTFRVLGIMPAGFEFPYPLHSPRPDLWANTQSVPGRFVPGNNFHTIGLRDASTTTTQVRAAAQTVASQISAAEPRFYGPISVDVVALHEAATRDVRGIVAALAAAFLIVTVLGGANLAHLFIARGVEFRQEATIRVALGARAIDLVRVNGLELGVLLVVGGAVGLPLTYQILTVMPRFVPAGLHLPRAGALLSDPSVLIAALLGWVSIGVALTGGVWTVTRGHLFRVSPMVTPSMTGARVTGRGRASRLLLSSEVGLAFVLTVSALSMLEHVRGQLRADAGLELDRIFIHTQATGLDAPAGRSWVPVEFHVVSENYDKLGGLTVTSGRWLQRSDVAQGIPVVIINDVMARRYFPGVDPVGQRLRFDQGDIPQVWTAAGVVKEHKRLGLQGEPRPAVFVPWAQVPRANVSLVMRSAGKARLIAKRVRDRAIEVLPGSVEVQRVRTGSEVLAAEMAASRFLATQLTGLAALSLLLAATGFYGVMAHTTALRARELAVRIAVGSSPDGIVRLVTGDALKAVLAGLLGGLPLAFALERLARRAVGATEWVSVPSYGATAVLFVLLCVCVTLPIARRASRVAPATLLSDV